MTPYYKQFVPNHELALFEKIEGMIINMKDIDLGDDENGDRIILSCHMLARAVAKLLKQKYVDGYFYPNFEHSWIVLPSGAIVDLYPISILGGPILMAGGCNSVTETYYTACSSQKISCGRFSQPSFKRSVQRILRALKQTLN